MNIKGFKEDLTCRGYQFEIGGTYKTGAENITADDLCSSKVFHYCKSLQQVHSYYNVQDKNNRYCEVAPLGEEVTNGYKCGTNIIKVVREITGEELKELKGLNNGNTGIFNIGSHNSGSHNSGSNNIGSNNSGDNNSGWNNSGWNNSGDNNSGNNNSGSYNIGLYNSCDNSNGIFCNKSDTNIRIFNISSGMSLRGFTSSRYWDALYSVPFRLVKMVDGELVTQTYKEACAEWWEKTSEANKKIIQKIPNFDTEVFEDITGIRL